MQWKSPEKLRSQSFFQPKLDMFSLPRKISRGRLNIPPDSFIVNISKTGKFPVLLHHFYKTFPPSSVYFSAPTRAHNKKISCWIDSKNFSCKSSQLHRKNVLGKSYINSVESFPLQPSRMVWISNLDNPEVSQLFNHITVAHHLFETKEK